MSILLTGAAGFIGFHVAKALLDRGDRVMGIDNLNDYYDVRLKEARLAQLGAYPGFVFAKLDVAFLPDINCRGRYIGISLVVFNDFRRHAVYNGNGTVSGSQINSEIDGCSAHIRNNS